MCLEGAELNVYTTDGQTLTVDLSMTQLSIVCKILGLKFPDSQTINYFSDETLKKFAKMKGNPLMLKEVW